MSESNGQDFLGIFPEPKLEPCDRRDGCNWGYHGMIIIEETPEQFSVSHGYWEPATAIIRKDKMPANAKVFRDEKGEAVFMIIYTDCTPAMIEHCKKDGIYPYQRSRPLPKEKPGLIDRFLKWWHGS